MRLFLTGPQIVDEAQSMTSESTSTKDVKAESKGLFNTLRSEWGQFLVLILNPLILTTIGVAALFLILKASLPSSQSLPAPIDVALTLVIALTSGVAGALFSDRWIKSRETSTLVTRGKSAIRGLTLLLTNISLLEQRVKRHEQRLLALNENQGKQQRFHVISSYEEITDGYHRLQEEVINAIEEWQDIIPEVASLKTQIGVITKLNNEVSIIQQERRDLELQVEEERKKSNQDQTQIGHLQRQLQEKDKELKQVTERLDAQRGRFSGTILGDISAGSAPSYSTSYSLDLASLGLHTNPLTKTCASCGEQIPGSFMADRFSEKCPKCGKNPNHYITGSGLR